MDAKKYIVPIFALTASVVAIGTLAITALTRQNSVQMNKPSVGKVTAGIHSVKKEVENEASPVDKREEKTDEATEADTYAPDTDDIESRSEKLLELAQKAVDNCTDSSMTKEEKLKAAFDYIKTNYLEGSRRSDYREIDWPVVYAEDLLEGGKGDCFSYAAAFAYMAKAIGYEECYACNSGGHGWAEIDGKIYDPEWSMHNSKYSYFGMSYDDPCDVKYKESIGFADWTHVEV